MTGPNRSGARLSCRRLQIQQRVLGGDPADVLSDGTVPAYQRQGITTGSGLRAHAEPTARTARGFPTAAARQTRNTIGPCPATISSNAQAHTG